MSEPIVVIGAGGFGREVLDVIEAINCTLDVQTWNLLGVVDDSPAPINLTRLSARNVAYLGTVEDLIGKEARPQYVLGIGSPALRMAIVEDLDAAGFRAATLIDPEASVGSRCVVGEGTVVLPGARVTTNVQIGRHVHLNPNVTIGHDTVLRDFVSVNPAASVSGDCVVETGALIGVGAVVLNQLTVGAGAIVGGAACVVKDVQAKAVVRGVPAR